MNVSEEEKLQLLWKFVREGQWIEGDKHYAVSREFVRAERLAIKYNKTRVWWDEEEVLAALLEAQREVRRETLEQCLEVVGRMSNAGFIKIREAIRALLAEEKISG